MKESSTYQAILAEGRAEGEARGRVDEARRLLIKVGSKHLGSPDARTKAKIEAISDVAQLDQLTERTLEVERWDKLWT